MKHAWVCLCFLVGCASTTLPPQKATKSFSSFDHLKEKKPTPFNSTFLNPVFVIGNASKKTPPIAASASGPLQSTAYLFFVAYQNTLSRLDGATCNFAPTCSAFALRAISKYAPLGFGIAFGRLHKNHLDHDFYIQSPPRLSDPLTNYTFWLGPTTPDNFDAHSDPAHAWFQHVSLVNSR